MGAPVPYETIDARGEDVTEYLQIDYMPADPALKAVYLDDEDGEVYFGPVLCWQIQTIFVLDVKTDAYTYPVTQAGEESLTPVLYPDGVVRVWDEVYESLEAWTKERREQLRIEKELDKEREEQRKEQEEKGIQGAPHP